MISGTLPYDHIHQAFRLCSTGEDGLNLSYECLTSERARTALKERIAASPEFAKNLQQLETKRQKIMRRWMMMMRQMGLYMMRLTH